MTLVSSGDIHLIGSSAAPTRSICFELYGNYTGPRNLTTMAIAAGFSSPYDIVDFYGYTAVEPPGDIASVTGVDSGAFATCTYTTSSGADNYRVQYSISPFTVWNPSAGGGAYDLVSPYTVTLGNGTWRFRVCGENAAGLGNYTTSASFTMS